MISILCTAGGQVASADEDAETRRKWEATFDQDILPIVKARCVECHSGDDPDGGFDIGRFTSGEKVSAKLDRWSEVGKRIRLKEMPPEGSPPLDDRQEAAIHRWLDASPEQNFCASLATDQTQRWYRGYVMSRRLTRTEYLNAIRDLIGISVPSQIEVPSDGSGGEGFDTVGASLFTSAIHVERYLSVASDVIERATPETIAGGTDTASQEIHAARKRLLVQLPSDDVPAEQAARTVIAAFARRAWRRNVADEEIERLMPLFQSARERDAGFVVAVREPLKAILVSPHFLFVVESESPAGGIQKLTPHQLATRLALFIWSSVPDAELLRLADSGELETNEHLIAQVHRMLADPKAQALGENFGLQWLGLANFLSSAEPDREVYPEFDHRLATDMRKEAVELVASVFREDRSILELIDSQDVYVNGNLARHYGIDLADDAPWQRIQSGDRRRGGVMTLAAVLTSTSYPRRTSPVLRGRWVLEELLGASVPPPPPGVPALDESETSQAVTLRQRLELHRKNPACANCHNRMDPLGFGLENFDGLGRWRDSDAGAAIDASGELPSGQTFQGPEELKQVLLGCADEFQEHLVKKMLSFALGRELNKFDECVIEDCRKQLESRNHRARVIVETIVTSYPFQHRFFKAAKRDG